jgi:hypothetical protein
MGDSIMLRTPENLRAVLDFLVSKPDFTAAAHSIGAGRTSKLLFDWINRSNRGDPEFLIDWPEGSEPQQFAQLILVARKRYIALFEHKLRDEVMSGIPRVQIKDGEIIWARDPKLCADALDPEIWKMLHGSRAIEDTYARDENGALVPSVIFESAPAHLKIHVSKGLMPALYGEHRTIDVNARVAASVVHVREKQMWTPMKQIEQQVPTQIEQTIEPAPAHVAPAEWDRYAPHPDDRADIAEMKRAMRHKLSRPPSLSDPRIVTDARTGVRMVATVPYAAPPTRNDDPPELVSGSNVPADAPAQARPARRDDDRVGAGPDPSKLAAVTIDGKRTTTLGARVV